jgi:hypothetical protein
MMMAVQDGAISQIVSRPQGGRALAIAVAPKET